MRKVLVVIVRERNARLKNRQSLRRRDVNEKTISKLIIIYSLERIAISRMVR